jgi:hypothetical protein
MRHTNNDDVQDALHELLESAKRSGKISQSKFKEVCAQYFLNEKIVAHRFNAWTGRPWFEYHFQASRRANDLNFFKNIALKRLQENPQIYSHRFHPSCGVHTRDKGYTNVYVGFRNSFEKLSNYYEEPVHEIISVNKSETFLATWADINRDMPKLYSLIYRASDL